ncbi:MAG: flagellar motor switch protein FliM [Fimbriimonadaceae bacterium]|nr:flagellar motor switch protein FliM [Fimbriimonadaceae bacterium]
MKSGGELEIKRLSDVLSQAEIESLMNSLAASEENAAGSSLAAAKGKKQGSSGYEVYDFRRPDKFSKEQLRTLQMLHETFARLTSTGLSALLRTPVTIDLISVEQVPYEEYLRSINSSLFVVFSLPPLNGQAVIEMEFSLVFTMLDKLLGGPGKPVNRNNLTDVEIPLIQPIMSRLFDGIKASWEGVVITNPVAEGMETNAQFVQVTPPNDIVVSILFEMMIGSTHGAMSLCVPYMLLKPITNKLSAQKWFATQTRRSESASRTCVTNMIQKAELSCGIELGRCGTTLEEVLNLKVGDVIRLNQKKDRDLIFLVDQIPKLFVKPALDGKKLVFTVSHIYED